MNMHHHFMKELASIHRYEKKSAADQLLRRFSKPPESSLEKVAQVLQQGKIKRRDLEDALGDLFYGVLHSVLVAVDGGTALSEKGRVRLVDEKTGKDLGEGLHELLPEYLKLK